MYDYSGVIYRVFAGSGWAVLLGGVYLLLQKPWSRNFAIKRHIGLIILLILCLCILGSEIKAIVSPNIESYTGEFIDSHNDSRVVPFTFEYVFWNGEGKRAVFHLDSFSKKKIFPLDFIEGEHYTVWYEKSSKVIVKVDVVS